MDFDSLPLGVTHLNMPHYALKQLTNNRHQTLKFLGRTNSLIANF